MGDSVFQFPKLIDSTIESGIVTYNTDLKNPKERLANCSLELNETNGDKSHINFLIDYPTLFNLSYQMKSMVNQIDETIKNFNK